MGGNTGLNDDSARRAPAGAPSITTDAELRYQRACKRPKYRTTTEWLLVARGLDWEASHAYVIGERLRLRGLADDCRARAEAARVRRSPSGKFAARSVKAVAA